ncbi:hypothetical protein [Escherichia coli]|uniref:hypothetical protein n=1 Tax=Escherichia coli TaxID=562 RepID=UPI000657FF9B|nr:hypothetical protein [Escherichia coli]KLX63934.1 hypothetical protein SK79_01217 [Escherichia coli]
MVRFLVFLAPVLFFYLGFREALLCRASGCLFFFCFFRPVAALSQLASAAPFFPGCFFFAFPGCLVAWGRGWSRVYLCSTLAVVVGEGSVRMGAFFAFALVITVVVFVAVGFGFSVLLLRGIACRGSVRSGCVDGSCVFLAFAGVFSFWFRFRAFGLSCVDSLCVVVDFDVVFGSVVGGSVSRLFFWFVCLYFGRDVGLPGCRVSGGLVFCVGLFVRGAVDDSGGLSLFLRSGAFRRMLVVFVGAGVLCDLVWSGCSAVRRVVPACAGCVSGRSDVVVSWRGCLWRILFCLLWCAGDASSVLFWLWAFSPSGFRGWHPVLVV